MQRYLLVESIRPPIYPLQSVPSASVVSEPLFVVGGVTLSPPLVVSTL